MRTEMVVLRHAALVRIHDGGALFGRTDAIFPVVLVRKAAAWPSDDRNLDGFQSLHNILPDAIDIRDFRIGSYPDTFIDASAQMLRKLTIYITADVSFFPVQGYLYLIQIAIHPF